LVDVRLKLLANRFERTNDANGIGDVLEPGGAGDGVEIEQLGPRDETELVSGGLAKLIAERGDKAVELLLRCAFFGWRRHETEGEMMRGRGGNSHGDACDGGDANVVDVFVQEAGAGAANDYARLSVDCDGPATCDVLVRRGDEQWHGFAESDIEDVFQGPCGEEERVVGHCKFTIPG